MSVRCHRGQRTVGEITPGIFHDRQLIGHRLARHVKVQGFRQIGSGSNLPGSHNVNDTCKTETEIRYSLTDCDADPAILARAIRRHWSIENALLDSRRFLPRG